MQFVNYYRLIVSVVMSSSHEIKTKDAYLVDCSIGKKNVEMIKNTYDDLIKEGFTVHRIVITHPDEDHCGGYGSICGFDRMISSSILVTDRFQFKYPFSFKVGKYNESRDTGPFNLSYTSFTSDLVLHTINKIAQPIVHHRDGTFIKDKDDHDNESSIITTITMNNGGNTILACLTGDAFFDTSETAAQFLHIQEIIVFQVPHHGSKHNSKIEFYRQIAQKTQHYLISCGHHGSYGFPHKEVLTAIRDATVANKKEGATIVLTDGTNLNGMKVSSFTGHDHEPSISYWDPYLRRSDCKLINKDFLQFTFSGEGNLVGNPLQNLIQWSNKGYKHMADSYNPKQRLRIHLKPSNNSHLVVDALIITEDYQEADDGSIKGFQILSRLKTQQCQGEGCTASIEGYLGLPAPTDPCTWDNRVIMVDGIDDLIFLQLENGKEIYYQKYKKVKAEIEKILGSTDQYVKKLILKANDFKENVPLLSTALTNLIFRHQSTAAQKIKLIEAIRKSKPLNSPKDAKGIYRMFKTNGFTRDTYYVMNFLEIVLRMKNILQERKTYPKEQYRTDLFTIKSNISHLLEAAFQDDDIITSLDYDSSIVFFKCHNVPWQIVYGIVSNNGKIDWPVEYVHNSLQMYTPMTLISGTRK